MKNSPRSYVRHKKDIMDVIRNEYLRESIKDRSPKPLEINNFGVLDDNSLDDLVSAGFYELDLCEDLFNKDGNDLPEDNVSTKYRNKHLFNVCPKCGVTARYHVDKYRDTHVKCKFCNNTFEIEYDKKIELKKVGV